MARKAYIDFLKGLTILSVVIRHVSPDLIPGQAGTSLYSLQVPIFFYISGLLESSKSASIRLKIVDSVNKLLIPYCFWFTICILIFIPASLEKFSYTRSLSTHKLDTYFLFMSTPGKKLVTNYPTWFLLALFEIKIIVELTNKLLEKKYISDYTKYFFLFSLVIVGYVLCLFEFSQKASILSSMINLPFYMLGSWMKKRIYLIEALKRERRIDISVLILIVFISFFVENFDSNNCIIPSNIFLNYTSLCLLIILIHFIVRNSNGIPFINYLGENTMIILVVHVIVLNFVSSKIDSIERLFYTILLTVMMIPICNTWLPMFVGKKSFIQPKV